MRHWIVIVLLAAGVSPAHDLEGTNVTYLGNSGVFAANGEGQIVFDPLFRNDFGTYERVPLELEERLFAREDPFAGVDAIFISHHHGDHFSAELLIRILRDNSSLLLFAPQQAVTAMQAIDDISGLAERIVAVHAEVGDSAQEFQVDNLQIDVVRLPHSGWPDRMTDVENLVWRVRLDGADAITHFGDATTNPEAFATTAAFWSAAKTKVALPPYWFFLSSDGRAILRDTVNAQHVIGVHVPAEIDDDPRKRPAELQDVMLFTRPGEKQFFSD